MVELSGILLNDAENIHHWKFEASGTFSTKSAYMLQPLLDR
jgi:hypothetical protein